MRIKKSFGDRAIDQLVARLSAARASKGGSPTQWHSLDTVFIIPVLESVVEFQGLVPEIDRRQVIEKAVYGAATEKILDREALISHLKRAEGEYLAKHVKKFILATSWTASPRLNMKGLRLRGATIAFSPPGGTRVDLRPLRSLIEDVMPRPAPEMLQVQATVSARSPSAVIEIGQHAVDYTRGILNFLINRRVGLRIFDARPQRAVNEILPGPIHTVHTSQGKPAVDAVWYELYGVERIGLFGNASLLGRIEGTARRIRRWVKESYYEQDVEHAFVRYTRALDCQDHAVAFSRLWTTVEYLAGTSDHEKLVRRVAALFPKDDYGFAETVMRHLRDVRNGVVHVDPSRTGTDMRSGMEVYLYQLKKYVELLLHFHLVDGRRFTSRASSAELLDAPTDPEELRRLIRHYRSVLRRRA
ncbi:MAG: hypothetical protein IPJ98_27965 [Bryobacterales bacterium]|nr:hypothetical protein [Bryobacterales bacterium]